MDPGIRTLITRTFRTRPRTLKVCKPITTEQTPEPILRSRDPCDRCPRRPMALTLDALGIVAVASAIGWWAVGIVSAVRSRVASPFERALATASFLIGALAFVTPYASVSVDGPLSDLRLTFIALATLLVLLATKWISRGHSRYDALLVVPVIASLTLVWDGFVPNGFDSEWPSYVFWALQQIPYLAAAIVLWGTLYRGRGDLATPVHQRFFWTVGLFVMILAIGLGTNIAGRFLLTRGDPWLASFLLFPAAISLFALVPLPREALGEMLRVVSAIQERVTAIYMFYRTGEPLVALASNRNLPIEPEQLEAV